MTFPRVLRIPKVRPGQSSNSPVNERRISLKFCVLVRLSCFGMGVLGTED